MYTKVGCYSVLTDLVTVLLHPNLLDELFIPQPVATHAVIKQLLQDISATSIMKLDDYSMGKLWDLMTMILKWQLSVATNQNVFDISRRHLRCVATLMPKYFSTSIFENVLKKFELLARNFTNEDHNCLCNTLIIWFSEYHTKISVLLRLGLQNKDGTFCLPRTINPKLIKNLGENIYTYDTNKKIDSDYKNYCLETNEINYLLASIEKVASKSNQIELQLPINFGNENVKNKMLKINREIEYKSIPSLLKSTNKNNDLTFVANLPKSPQEDLLEMLKQSSEF